MWLAYGKALPLNGIGKSRSATPLVTFRVRAPTDLFNGKPMVSL